MKKTLSFTLTLFTLLGASACSDEGDDDTPAGTGGDVSGTGGGSNGGAGGEAGTDCVPEILEPELLDNDYTLPMNTCWIVDQNLNIEHPLTVEEGVVISVEQGFRLNVRDEGRLSLNGTEDSPISITGTDQTDGYWQGIQVDTTGTANSWSYATIEYAGSDGHNGNDDSAAAVFITANGAVAMDHTTITHSAWYALIAQGEEGALDGFMENSFTDNERLMRLGPDLVGSLDEASSFADNEDNFVRFPWSNTEDVSHDQTWENLSAPYLVLTRVRNHADLVVAPGARVEFAQDGYLEIGDFSDATGSLSAVGTADKPIIFTGNDTVNGYFKGIGVFTNASANKLEHVEINYGGSDGWTGNAETFAGLYLAADGGMALSNVSFSESGGYGIYLTEDSSITCDALTFDANTDGEIYDDASDSVLTSCPSP